MIYTQVGNVRATVHTQTFPGGELQLVFLNGELFNETSLREVRERLNQSV